MEKTQAYKDGWKACEAGKSYSDNPYRRSGTQMQTVDWSLGFSERAERGFDVSRLPRKPSGAFDTARFPR